MGIHAKIIKEFKPMERLSLRELLSRPGFINRRSEVERAIADLDAIGRLEIGLDNEGSHTLKLNQ